MSKILVSINTSGADLLKIANGRSAQKHAAEAEISRRVTKRHLAGKSVPKAMQLVANRVEDRAERVAAENLEAAKTNLTHVVSEMIDSGALRWDGDMLVSA